MPNHHEQIELDIQHYLRQVNSLELNVLDKLSEIETYYIKVKWTTLARLIPKFIFKLNYSLEATLDINDPSSVYLFTSKTIKDIVIDPDKLTITTMSIDGLNATSINIGELDELLFINKEGDLYELTDVLSYLLDEHVMPTQKPVTDNIIEVNFKTKKLM